jgi:hypothetical protein
MCQVCRVVHLRPGKITAIALIRSASVPRRLRIMGLPNNAATVSLVAALLSTRTFAISTQRRGSGCRKQNRVFKIPYRACAHFTERAMCLTVMLH